MSSDFVRKVSPSNRNPPRAVGTELLQEIAGDRVIPCQVARLPSLTYLLFKFPGRHSQFGLCKFGVTAIAFVSHTDPLDIIVSVDRLSKAVQGIAKDTEHLRDSSVNQNLKQLLGKVLGHGWVLNTVIE